MSSESDLVYGQSTGVAAGSSPLPGVLAGTVGRAGGVAAAVSVTCGAVSTMASNDPSRLKSTRA